MRKTDCKNYLNCLDDMARISKTLDCEGCPDVELDEEDEGIIETDPDFMPRNLKTLDSPIPSETKGFHGAGKPGNDEKEETMKTPCIVKGCNEEKKIRGLCGLHYRLWKKGNTSIQPLPSKTSGKIKVVRPEVVKAPLPAVIINQDNSETYKAAAVMFIRSIERKVVDAIKVELEERGA